MYGQEKIKPYGEGEKAQQVEQMFDNIAPTYDRLNHRLSWNIDRGWRRKAIRSLMPHQPQTLLDIATGTGDFAILAAEMLRPKNIVGADISEGMMAVGRQKVEEKGLSEVIKFQKEDCLALSYPDESFDAVTAAFGIRNFAELEKGLGEMCRVLKKGGHLSIVELTAPLKKGGHLSIVELTAPPKFPMKQLFRLYSHTFLPAYGKWLSKDKRAYDYLTATIEAFPQGEKMLEILKKAGFEQARFQRMTFGICTHYMATK